MKINDCTQTQKPLTVTESYSRVLLYKNDTPIHPQVATCENMMGVVRGEGAVQIVKV